MSEPVITQCDRAYAAADPWLLAAPDVCWVMDLDAYKRIRAAAKLLGRDDPEDDPEKWQPDPGDRLMGMPIKVREDGGEPHLKSDLASRRHAVGQDRR